LENYYAQQISRKEVVYSREGLFGEVSLKLLIRAFEGRKELH
jgi:hypothetical protein